MSDDVEALKRRVAELERPAAGCFGILGRVALGIVALFAVLAAIGSCLPDPPPSPPSDDQFIHAAKDMVKATLRDPASAAFNDLVVYRHGEKVAVCGTVNARNGFGGMAGAERFFVSGNVVMTEGQDREAFPLVWDSLCRPGWRQY